MGDYGKSCHICINTCDRYRRATYKLDGVPMCTKHADYYKNDFEKIVKIKNKKK